MTRLTLTSTTALMIGLSISSATAQEAAFPCNLPDGTAIADAQALAAAIGDETLTADLVVTDDPAVCGPGQLAAAQALIMEAAGAGEPVDAPEAVVAEDAPEAPAADAPAADAPAAAEAEAAAPAAEATLEAESPPEAPEQEAEPEVAPAEEAAPAPEQAPATEDAAVVETPVTEGSAETAEPVDTAPADAPAADETSTSDTQTEAAPDEEAPAAADATEETLSELTAEELAERDARRAERAAARQQSAAATAEPDSAEVITEEVQSDDVRSADEDFDTQVLSDTATAENDEGGLSRFEQALLLGLGAATVGAILNNGDAVVSNSGDRVIVERDGELRVLRDDNTLLRQPGAQIATQTFDDGSTLTTVTREDGSFVTTIRAADGTVLRRTLTRVDGTQVNLIDDLAEVAPIDVTTLPQVQTQQQTQLGAADDAALRAALTAGLLTQTGRAYSLEQVREVQQVRVLAPQVELDTITFASGSAAIQPSEAEELGALGRAMLAVIANDPGAVFLIEGHTDAVGDAAYNLGLSDRRAETVALALTQYFGVPPENLVTQGYGEAYLKVRTLAAERENRRAAVRNITPLLRDS